MKSVKFSSQQQTLTSLEKGHKVVTVLEDMPQRPAKDAAKTRAVARQRKFWRQLRVHMQPRYWAHVLNKKLPLIYPDSTGRRSWDMLIIILVLFNCAVVPYQVGYSTPAPWVIDPLNRAIDALFAVDIGLNFRTCYVDASARLVRDGHQIALHYLRTWFAVDLIATIPFDLIISAAVQNLTSSQLTALALLRTPRLLRLVRLFRILERLRGANFIRMLKLLFLMASIAHMVSCLWHLMYKLDPSEQMWTFDYLGSGTAEITFYLQGYLNTLYIMIGNDVFPANDVERLYCTLVLVMGACFYAIVVGNMSLLVNNLNPTASRHRFKKDIIVNTIRYLDIPKQLSRRINVYFEFLTQYSHPGTDGTTLINQLPSSMAQDINSWCYRSMLVKVPLFKDCEDAFITQLVMRIKLSVYLTGEVIFRIGDVGHEMYLVCKGDVAVINRHQELLALLSKGGFFGELALLATARRTAHCVSVSQCDLAMLMANDLVSAMRDFPDSAALVRECAVQRLNELQAAGDAEGTDADGETDMEDEETYEDDNGYDQNGYVYTEGTGDAGEEVETTGDAGEGGDTAVTVTGTEAAGGAAAASSAPNTARPRTGTGTTTTTNTQDNAAGVGLRSMKSMTHASRTQASPRDAVGSGHMVGHGGSSRRRSIAAYHRSGTSGDGAGAGLSGKQLSKQMSIKHSMASQPSFSRMRSGRIGRGGSGRKGSALGLPVVRPAPRTFHLNFENTEEWMQNSLDLLAEMHTLVTRLNGKVGTMGDRLEEMQDRIVSVNKAKESDLLQGHAAATQLGDQGAMAAAMLDFDQMQ